MAINLFNIDCMKFMEGVPDKAYDLAIVDPPYGSGQRFNFRYGSGNDVYENKAPPDTYFNELFRVSVNQIIWGANYFTDKLPVNRCWISWYKGNPIDSFSDFELAWTSFDQTSRCIKLESYGYNHADKRHSKQSTIHPTQKPISLYRKLLTDYAKEGDKILDTHLGSGSSAIAAHEMGFEFDGCEINKKYYEDSIKRFNKSTAQTQMFNHGK